MLFDEISVVHDPTPHAAALNMAIDEILLRAATRPLLRIYRWAHPATSFGYFGKWSEAHAAGPEGDLVRRWTGGGIVQHGNDLTFSLIVPHGHPFFAMSPRESYCAIHRYVAKAIEGATLAASSAAPVSAACFQNPVEHDILLAGRKIVGGAQRRTKAGLLHQGSIQAVEEWEELAETLSRAFATKHETTSIADEMLAKAEVLSQEKYASETWMRRVE